MLIVTSTFQKQNTVNMKLGKFHCHELKNGSVNLEKQTYEVTKSTQCCSYGHLARTKHEVYTKRKPI